MSRMRVLITGGSGLLGSNLARAWQNEFEIHLIDLLEPDRFPVGSYFHLGNVTDIKRVKKLLLAIRPRTVIHAAGMVDVDRCEQQFEQAYQANVVGSEVMGQVSKVVGARMVQISTDMVFDGKLKRIYKESDNPHPLNTYAMTKLVAEKRITAIHPNVLILRTAFWGWNMQRKLSLAEFFLKNLVEEKKIFGTDVQTSSLYCSDVANILLALMRKHARGIFHVGSRKAVTKYRLACLLGKQFGLPISKIAKRTVAQMEFEARRPIYLALDVSKTEKLLGYKLPTTQESVRRFYQETPDDWQAKLRSV